MDNKIQIVEVKVRDKATVNAMMYELDVIDVSFDGNMYSLKIMAKDKERRYFAANNVRYAVVLEDAVAKVEWRGYKKARTLRGVIPGISGQPGSGDPGLTIETGGVFDPTNVTFNAAYGYPGREGYRTVTEYYSEMNYLQKHYPNLVKLHQLGLSFENVPIFALEISSAPGACDGRPGALHMAGSHAREWPSNELCMNLAWYLVTQYGKISEVTNLLNTTACWLLPVVNPDGTHWDQRNYPGTWRKNRVKNSDNTFGVDINRNWPYGWGANSGSSDLAYAETYRGTGPGSEKEVRAASWVYENNQIISSISGHTFGQTLLYAWGHRSNEPGSHPLLVSLGRELAARDGHTPEYSEQLYYASGDLCDYAYGAMRTLGFTLEYGRYTALYNPFIPPYMGTDAQMTDSVDEEFKKQIGAFMDNMSFARTYAAHIKGRITDSATGAPVKNVTLRLELEVTNITLNAGTYSSAPSLKGTTKTTQTCVYFVKDGVYDWSVAPSAQPELEYFGIPNVNKGYTVTASCPGYESQSQNVKVGWYQDVAGNVNFQLRRTPPAEDCLPIDYSKVSVALIGNRYKIVQGAAWLLDFGTDQASADKALNIIKFYKFTSQCFVGRPNPSMQYFLCNGASPAGAFPGEDAIGFNPSAVTVEKINNSWKIVEGAHWILDFASNEADARKAFSIIQKYGFNRICFVGRPNPPMMYFRK